MKCENKYGPKEKVGKHDNINHKTFIYRCRDIYNRLPRQLTLLKNHQKFKKCLNKISLNSKSKLIIPKQDDNKEPNTYDYDASDQCVF